MKSSTAGKRKVVRKEPQTYEDFLEIERQQFETLHRDEEPNIPPVNYRYAVGERVEYGALQEARIEEVIEDGRVLHISFHDRGQVYGKPYDAGRKPRLVWWNMICPLAQNQNTKFSRPRIHTEYMQTSLDSLLHTTYHRGTIDSPDYQRDYVWTLTDKQRLIKSIFNRADIGKFLLLEYPHPEYRLEIVDGKQRLGAIREFVEGRFEFEGLTWFQLSPADRQAFGDDLVQVGKLQAKYTKKSDVLWLFLQINRAGVPQTEEHIAKAQALYDAALIEESK